MALMYKPSKHAFRTEGESLTEQEHVASCDINKMIRDAHRGVEVRGGSSTVYGYDDTTMDAVSFRIEKERLEADLAETARSLEFSEDELSLVPEKVQKKFGFRKKAAVEVPPKSDDDLNDDGSGGPAATTKSKEPPKV